MKHLILTLILVPLAAFAQDKHSADTVKQDVQRHRAMAVAHEAAAKCLESGKGHDACMRDLLAACKGMAIGKYCGMRHAH